MSLLSLKKTQANRTQTNEQTPNQSDPQEKKVTKKVFDLLEQQKNSNEGPPTKKLKGDNQANLDVSKPKQPNAINQISTNSEYSEETEGMDVSFNGHGSYPFASDELKPSRTNITDNTNKTAFKTLKSEEKKISDNKAFSPLTIQTKSDGQNIPVLPQPKKPNTIKLPPIKNADPHYDNNKKAISSFPKDDKDAQIKGFDENGYKGNELKTIDKNASYNARHNFRQYGTQLDETVEIMEKTLLTAHQKFDSLNIQINCVVSTKEIQDALIVEKILLEGLLNIKETYDNKYPNGHAGLEQLSQLIIESQNKIKEHITQLAEACERSGTKLFFKIEDQKFLQTINESSHDLAAYCARLSGSFSIEEAKAQILKGQTLLKKIYSANGTLPSKYENEACKQMTCITWFLMYCALKQNQGFNEGSFVIENGDKLFNFMHSSSLRKVRPSSHFTERTDVAYEVLGDANCMPANKKVVLFSMIKSFSPTNKVLFFKPENYPVKGSYIYSVLHGVEYLIGQVTKATTSGNDDLTNMQKERVPSEVLQAFGNLTKYFTDNYESYKPTLHQMLQPSLERSTENAKAWGIAYLRAFVMKFRETHKLELPLELTELLTRLEDTWKSFDNLENRTGREVYINKQQLQEFLDSKLDFSSGTQSFAFGI